MRAAVLITRRTRADPDRRFPTAIRAGAPQVTGTVEVSSQQVIQGMTTTHGDAFLVRDGRIATLPSPKDPVGIRLDLGPGKVADLPAEVILGSCDPGGVRPGSYELYVLVALIPDHAALVESFGGPWPFEVT